MTSLPDDHAVLRARQLIGAIDQEARSTKLKRFFEHVPADLDLNNPPAFMQAAHDPSSPETWSPYPWQMEFYQAGDGHRRRCLMCANRVGKTLSCSCEVAVHATGDYPDCWRGRRFNKPPLIWVGAETNEAARSTVQEHLLGEGTEWGTGWIPAEAIHDEGPKLRQAGISNVVDSVRVKHKSGGWSRLVFKTYEQGRRRWQGAKVDVVWLDEEPPPEIYTEAITRTLDTGGITILSFTPLQGMGPVVKSFMDNDEDSQEGGKNTYVKNATWDDAPHLTEEDKEAMLREYPEHERDTRAKGIPMMGEGAIFPIDDERIMCDPFEIPEHYFRVVGIDFGWDHPTAAVWVAYDADRDVIYVYDCYRQSKEVAAVHASAIRRRGEWIPVAWPHDGLNTEKGGGVQLAQEYDENGLNMMAVSARYDDDKGGGQPTEPIIMDVLQRMRDGRFKVFSTLDKWFEEKRMYHRKRSSGGGPLKIVRQGDDILSATFYAIMMLRYGEQAGHAAGGYKQEFAESDFDPTRG